MGSLTGISCRLCGYRDHVSSGGLRSNYQTRSSHPIICRSCDGLRHTNTLVDPNVCDDCGSKDIILYGKQTRLPESAPNDLEFDGDLDWKVGLHLCPACKKTGIIFDRFSRRVD